MAETLILPPLSTPVFHLAGPAHCRSSRRGCRGMKLRRTLIATIALFLTVTQGGCSAGYVLRAACEEAKILWRRQPIESVLGQEIDADTRAKLELTESAIREAVLANGKREKMSSLALLMHLINIHKMNGHTYVSLFTAPNAVGGTLGGSHSAHQGHTGH